MYRKTHKSKVPNKKCNTASQNKSRKSSPVVLDGDFLKKKKKLGKSSRRRGQKLTCKFALLLRSIAYKKSTISAS